MLLHLALYPDHVSSIERLMKEPGRFAAHLITIPPLFLSIPLGLMASNCLMWCVPAAKAASEAKAEGVKWASFKDAQTALAKAFCILLIPTLILGVAGAVALGQW